MEPHRDSESLKILPIGTSVSGIESNSKWVKVQVKDQTGWILASLIGPEKPTVEYTLSQYHNTPIDNIELRRMWIERSAALQPEDLPILRLLIQNLEMANEPQALNKALVGFRTLLNQDPIYFTKKSFIDGKPEDYLEIIPSSLSCRTN